MGNLQARDIGARMLQRRVIVTIDTITAMLGDYCSAEDIPASARAVKLMVKPQERLVAILAESPEWSAGQAPLQIKFHLKELYKV